MILSSVQKEILCCITILSDHKGRMIKCSLQMCTERYTVNPKIIPLIQEKALKELSSL